MGTRTTYLGIYQPGDNEIFDEQLNDNANSGLIDAGVLVEHNGWTAHAARVDNPHATTAAQVGALANLGTLSSIQFGTDAARPGTGAVTAYYVATDTGRWYQGTGIGWALLAMAQTTLVAMVNLSGGALVTGDLVVADQATPATANGVNISNAQDDPHVAGVVIVGGANLATVMVAIAGYVGQVNVNASGVTKGQFLRQSTTLKQAEGTPTTTGGSFGIALSAQGGGTSVSALLKGGGGGGTSNLLKYELTGFTGASFALPQQPAANGVVEVAVNGQVQQQGRDWTIAGSTISFPVAQWPAGLTNDDVNVIYLTAVAFNTGQFFQHQEVTLGVGATVWNLSATPVGVPLVTRGGIVQYQSKGHYTIVGNVLTFAEPISSAEDGVVSADYYVASGGQGDAATLNGHASALVPTPSAIPVMDAVTGFQPTGSVGLLSLAREVPRPNLLQNGGFEQWHYGYGPATINAAITADRWAINLNGTSTISAVRDTVNVDTGTGSTAALAVTYTQGSAASNIQQTVDQQVRGRTSTFAIRARCSTPNAVRAALWDNVNGFRYGPYHTGDGTWQTLAVTAPIATTAVAIAVVAVLEATCVVYLDNATLAPGTGVADYVPSIQYPDALPNQRLASDVQRMNLFVNGGFERWQRGNGPFSVNGTYGPDRWYIGIAGTDTLAVQVTNSGQDNASGSVAAAYCNFTLGTGAGGTNMRQIIKVSADGFELRGRQVALSMRVSNAAGAVNGLRISLSSDGSGAVGASSTLLQAGGYQTLTCTMFVPNDATYVYALVNFLLTGVYVCDSATLVVGDVPMDYVGLPPADDLARCQRYYEAPFFQQFVAAGQTTAATNMIFPWQFRARKPVVPTVTLSAPANWAALTPGGGGQAATGIALSGSTSGDGCAVAITTAGGLAPAGGASMAMPSGASPMTIEANP